MTSASLAPPTMEVPVEEMEMASPYQGQLDDFDIDIDLMDDQDQVSNMDSEMIGTEEFHTNSQPSLFQTDANDDADMAEPSAEGSMVDADNDIEFQYDATYEAEMQENDNVEIVDVSLPTVQIEITPNVENDMGELETTTDVSHNFIRDTHEYPPSTEDTPIKTGKQENGPQETDPQENRDQEPVIVLENTQQNVQLEPSVITENTETEAETENNITAVETNNPADPTDPEDPTDDNTEAAREDTPPKVENTEDKTMPSNEVDTESLVPIEGDQPKDELTREDEPLHPIKVSYQDSEISLFPPLEGDSAETFFLHDEDLAYSSISILFESLRTVLMGSIAESDILVIDVNALGVQLTEDSQHTSKITLYQILDIYLRLCHNDGIEEPEALYITLTSQPAAHLELASLEAAAIEGKGLSQISPSDYYENDSSLSEDNTHYLEAFSDPVEPEADVDSTTSKEVLNGDEVDEVAQEDHEEDQEKDDEEYDEEEGGDGHEESHEIDAGQEEYIENDDKLQSAVDQNDPESALVEVQDGTEETYTEETHVPEETVAYSDNENDEAGAHIDDLESGSSTLNPEEQPDVADVTEDGYQQDHFDDETDQVLDETAIGKAKTLDTEASGFDQEFVEENHSSPRDEEALHEQGIAPEYEDATEIPGNVAHQDHTPEPDNYLLGIAEDLMKTPSRDQQEDLIDYDYEDEFPEDDQNIQGSHADVNGSSGQLSDNENYDFEEGEFDESTGHEMSAADPAHIDSNSHKASAKRDREDEEEEHLVETNSPDTKRRRS